jgi:hypothetical protein
MKSLGKFRSTSGPIKMSTGPNRADPCRQVCPFLLESVRNTERAERARSEPQAPRLDPSLERQLRTHIAMALGWADCGDPELEAYAQKAKYLLDQLERAHNQRRERRR